MSILEHKTPSTTPDDAEDLAPSLWLPNSPNAKIRTYRGKSLQALLPKIRSELGDNAVILRERDGLMGGVGGFFATRFVEVQARAGGPSIDVYDGSDAELGELPAGPGAAPELAAAAAVRELNAPAADEPAPTVTASHSPSESNEDEFSARLAAAVRAWSPAEVLPADGPISEVPSFEPASEAPPRQACTDAPVDALLAALDQAENADVEANVEPSEPTAAIGHDATEDAAGLLPVLAKPAPVPVKRTGRTKLPKKLAAPEPMDTEAASRILGDLVEVGISDGFARELIGAAAAHGAAVAGGLRAAVRQELVRRVPQAPSLPANGGVIAFVGTGGSGKSVASAALASTYRYGSTLPVSVFSLGEIHEHRRLANVLALDEVPVTRVGAETARSGATALKKIERARQHSLVILDTPAVTPGNPTAVTALAGRLEQIRPDAVYLVLSAALASGAARRTLASLSPLCPAGLVISHADEAGQIGVLVELAATHTLPVTYLTAGADHRRSLIGTDPAGLAQLLVP